MQDRTKVTMADW